MSWWGWLIIFIIFSFFAKGTEKKQSARESERLRKQAERNATKLQREHERNRREIEKERRSAEKLNIAEEKRQFKNSLEVAKLAFENRCQERKNLRHKFIDQELK